MSVHSDNQQRLRPLPDLPVPRELAGWLGYLGDARFVALFSVAGAVHVGDGRIELQGEAGVWAAYAGHPRIAEPLHAAGFGDDPGRRLLLDRQLATAHLGPKSVVERFLREQWLRRGLGARRDATGEFERTLDGLKKAVDLMEDTSIEEALDRAELRRRRLEAMQQWLAGLD